MTVAVADGLMKAGRDADADTIKKEVIRSMKAWGRKYPYAGYGGRFIRWLQLEDDSPYGSWGNGSAMRVSSAGWLYDTLTCIASGIAEGFYGVPEEYKAETLSRMEDDMKRVYERFLEMRLL